MKTKKCFLFIFNGYADWEPALTVSGLQQFTGFEVLTFSTDGKPVRSMGNLNIQPDVSMKQVSAADVDLLLLPGGFSWEQGGNGEIKPLLDQVLAQGKAVAAICGATAFLGQHGYLDTVKHTSNHPDYYLKAVAPGYQGRQHYVMAPAVRDGNLITASGVSTVQFAEAIFEYFGLLEGGNLAEWFHYFQHPELTLQEANLN